MNEFWQQRIETQVREALAETEAVPPSRRPAALSRACPFRPRSPLYQAWFQEVVRQRAARQREESEERNAVRV